LQRLERLESAPNPTPPVNLPPTGVVATGLASAVCRLSAVAVPHLAALALMLETEIDFVSRLGFLLCWGVLNFFWIALLRPSRIVGRAVAHPGRGAGPVVAAQARRRADDRELRRP